MIRPDEAGGGRLVVSAVAGASALVRVRAATPLVLLAPRPTGLAAWVVAGSLGGGLVRGDHLALDVEVGPAARLLLTTQASTKVYRGRAAGADGAFEPASMALEARVGAGGLFASIPDPVVCFEDAAYTQHVSVVLGEGASLVLLDAFTAGRSARGERFRFRHLESAIQIDGPRGRIATDRLLLSPDDGPIAARFGDLDALASLYLLGPACAPLASRALATLGSAPLTPHASTIEVASPLADGALLRIASRRVDDLMAAVRRHLEGLDALVGEDLFSRRR